MKPIFQRTHFPPAPGGDRYEWQEAETVFEVPRKGTYVIILTASARNGEQNGTGDDDDLRLKLNDFPFGLYEIHEETVSWKGFGTSAAWDGASLKGGTKTIYFFVEFKKGEQKLLFFTDRKPNLKSIEVFELNPKKDFTLNNLRPAENIAIDRNGIPWISFVFLRVHPKSLRLTAWCQSAGQKNSTDGDNIKVVINGKILTNPEAPTSNTYKNFYFSGDQMQGQNKTLELKPEDLDFTENAVELWYDQTPILEELRIEFLGKQAYLKEWEEAFIKNPEEVRQKEYQSLQKWAKRGKKKGLKYSSQLLLHSLQENPPEVVFEPNDPLIIEIKKAKGTYRKIITLVKKELKRGKLEGEIIPDTPGTPKVNFGLSNLDLYLAIHGIQKISFKTTQKTKEGFDVEITLFDRFDFNPTNPLTKRGDRGEKVRVIRNYPIRIKLKEVIQF